MLMDSPLNRAGLLQVNNVYTLLWYCDLQFVARICCMKFAFERGFLKTVFYILLFSQTRHEHVLRYMCGLPATF